VLLIAALLFDDTVSSPQKAVAVAVGLALLFAGPVFLILRRQRAPMGARSSALARPVTGSLTVLGGARTAAFVRSPARFTIEAPLAAAIDSRAAIGMIGDKRAESPDGTGSTGCRRRSKLRAR
jgi:hypothetical protein